MTNQNLEQKAIEVLNAVELMGLDFIKRSQAHNPHLDYGLEHGLYDQEAVDAANTTYQNNKAQKVLSTVELMGLDFIKGSQAHNPHLDYGLQHKLFTPEDVDRAQQRYISSHRK